MKVYLAAAGQHNWPSIPDDIQERLLTVIEEYLNEEKLQVSLKRTRKKCDNSVKQHLAIGLRCAMRCLKQKQCSLVLVCSSLTPIILTKPILLLSQMHTIPAVRLKNLSTMLTKIFAIPHCSVIGFKSSCQTHEQLKLLVDNLLRIVNGCENQPATSSVTFLPGKIIAPYQNPKRMPAGISKKKKKK